MTTEEAIAIVSYKLGLKKGSAAKEDLFLCPNTIDQALKDKEDGTEKSIDLKQYMLATKVLKQHKAETFKTENQTFLTKNKDNPKIILTKSGLQYQVLRESTGTYPTLNNTVTVHYKGTLINGEEFDSSHSRGKPSTFAVKKVIQGWQEGLLLMTPGSLYKFHIPTELAYGERGNDSLVPPYATLIFEVELLSIQS